MDAIILAGGKGKRLGGVNKALIEMEGRTLIQRKIAQLEPFCDNIIISGEIESNLNPSIKIVPDEIADAGPLMGIYSALKEVRSDIAFCTAVDMPFFSEPLFKYMADYVSEFDVVIPCRGNRCEPLFAFYSTKCIAPISKYICKKNARVVSFLGDVNVKYVEEEKFKEKWRTDEAFFNINTESDILTFRGFCFL